MSNKINLVLKKQQNINLYIDNLKIISTFNINNRINLHSLISSCLLNKIVEGIDKNNIHVNFTINKFAERIFIQPQNDVKVTSLLSENITMGVNFIENLVQIKQDIEFDRCHAIELYQLNASLQNIMPYYELVALTGIIEPNVSINSFMSMSNIHDLSLTFTQNTMFYSALQDILSYIVKVSPQTLKVTCQIIESLVCHIFLFELDNLSLINTQSLEALYYIEK